MQVQPQQAAAGQGPFVVLSTQDMGAGQQAVNIGGQMVNLDPNMLATQNIVPLQLTVPEGMAEAGAQVQ